MSPPQAAAAAAAAVAAAAATAAVEVARQSIELTKSREFDLDSEFVPPGTPLRDALVDAPEVPDYDMDNDADTEFHGFGEHPIQPDLPSEGKDNGNTNSEPKSPAPPVSETHFLRKDGGNQPAVMNSIAGLFGVAGGQSSTAAADAAAAAEEASRDAAFEEALARVRQSRRDIADKAAKGFSDMKAYYEAELRNAKVGGDEEGNSSCQPIPLSILARPKGFAWDLDETALRRALPTDKELEYDREQLKQSMESVWPEPWKGSYSPPNEPADAPYPLSKQFEETNDRAPVNVPDSVNYPTEAAERVAQRAEEIAAAAAAADAANEKKKKASEEDVVQSALKSDRPSSPPIHASMSAPDIDSTLALATRVKQLQADLVASERREKHAERVSDEHERKCEQLQLELKEQKQKTQQRDLEARELGKAVAVLKGNAEEAKADSVDTARKLTGITSTAARLTSEAKEFNQRRSALERENATLVGSVNELKKECVGLKSKLSRVEGDNERLRERLEKLEEEGKIQKREYERVTRDVEVARREVRNAKSKDELVHRETSGLNASLQAAKNEINEMRRRYEYLEKVNFAVAGNAGKDTGPPRSLESRPIAHRDAPAARPFSSAYRGGAPPVPDQSAHRSDLRPPAPRPFSSAYRHADENVNPKIMRKKEESKLSMNRLSVEDIPAAGVKTRSSQGDHLGFGMVPEPGSERREAFASEYGNEHLGMDTKDHFGTGMNVFNTFEGAAAARDAATAEGVKLNNARRDAEERARNESTQRAFEANQRAVKAAQDAERLKQEAAYAAEQMDNARMARAEQAKARARVSTQSTEPLEFAARQPVAVVNPPPARTRYSATKASRKGREGSGWFENLGDTTVVQVTRQRPATAGANSNSVPWLLGTEDANKTNTSGDRVTGRASVATAPSRSDDAPFATADSFNSWSSNVAAAEQRLMQLSQEKDQLEGTLSRMPEGLGKTIEQRRLKANAEKRLDEVLKAASAARHQLKSANKRLGNA